MQHSRTAWMCRPGFPGLLELMESSAELVGAAFVHSVTLPIPSECPPGLLDLVGPTVHVGAHTSLQLATGQRLLVSVVP